MSITSFPSCALIIQPKEYSIEVDPQLITPQFDDGFTGQRSRKSRVQSIHNVSYLLCGDCYQSFRDWVRADLCDGSRAFLWADHHSGEQRRAVIVGGIVNYSSTNRAIDSFRADFQIRTS